MEGIDKYILVKYLALLSDLINSKISATEFENSYLEMYKNENHSFGYESPPGKILGNLFNDVDSFCSNPEISNYDKDDSFRDIDEIELLERAKKAFNELKVLLS